MNRHALRERNKDSFTAFMLERHDKILLLYRKIQTAVIEYIDLVRQERAKRSKGDTL